MKLRAHKWAGHLLDWVYPRECVFCSLSLRYAEDRRYLCASCEDDVAFIQGPSCSTCGAPFEGAVEGARQCPQCLALDPAFSEGMSLLKFRGIGQALVHTLKYARGSYLLHDIQRLTCRAPDFCEFLRGACLVPVPLHSRKQASRGFNQSQALAESWASLFPNAFVSNVLVRKRATLSQTGLSREERFRNVKNAFAIDRKALLNASCRYILIDDVFTTGATLNACAHVLRAAGAKRIGFATFSHG